MFINMQSKSQIGRDKIVDQIIHEVGLVRSKPIVEQEGPDRIIGLA
jgi:hypothetical protein